MPVCGADNDAACNPLFGDRGDDMRWITHDAIVGTAKANAHSRSGTYAQHARTPVDSKQQLHR
jgi:hypothetical protein